MTKGTIAADSGWRSKKTQAKSARFACEKGPKCPLLGQHCRTQLVPTTGVLLQPIGHSRQWPRNLRTPKNTPNCSLVAHTITYMSLTSAIGRIFNTYLSRDLAHNCVHFDRRPEYNAIVSFTTRIF